MHKSISRRSSGQSSITITALSIYAISSFFLELLPKSWTLLHHLVRKTIFTISFFALSIFKLIVNITFATIPSAGYAMEV